MADAMESESADAFVEPGSGARVSIGCGRKGGVKGAVKNGHLWKLRAKDFFDRVDPRHLEVIVLRRGLRQVGEGRSHLRRDPFRLGERLAAINDAMANRIDAGCGSERFQQLRNG